MEKLKGKHIIILESSDQGGKSSLSKYLQDNVEGKCHVLHSNYNKSVSKQAHRHQHFLLNKFASKQFHDCYYTHNNVVIMDRNYVSDIIYGQIGYGSRGTLKSKFRTLDKLFKILRRGNEDVCISFIYCRPKKIKKFFEEKEEFSFDTSKKEELLNSDENDKVRQLYDTFINSNAFAKLLDKHGIHLYVYNYHADPDYYGITKHLKDLEYHYSTETTYI